MPESDDLEKLRSHAERLEHIAREIGLELNEAKWKAVLRIMAENRPLMAKPVKRES